MMTIARRSDARRPPRILNSARYAHKKNGQKRSASMRKHASEFLDHRLHLLQTIRGVTRPTSLHEGRGEDVVEATGDETVSRGRVTNSHQPGARRHSDNNCSIMHILRSRAVYIFRKKRRVRVGQVHPVLKRSQSASLRGLRGAAGRVSQAEELMEYKLDRHRDICGDCV